MIVSSNFDGGNILVESINDDSGSMTAHLKIRPDIHNSAFSQWFYFRVQGVKGEPCNFRILNASECFAPEGWDGYEAVASYDRNQWFRVPTTYQKGILNIDHQPEFDSVFYAYFAPFSYEQHLDLVSKVQLFPEGRHQYIGKTVEGRDIDFLIMGQPSVFKKKIWILARQHPAETMSSWFVKGLLERLMDRKDPASIKLLRKSIFYVVPNMNLDGSIAGNLRTNMAGVDLNRAWANPDKEKSPEVLSVFEYMKTTGVDLCLDIHGDEALPYCFASRIDGIPVFNKTLADLQKAFTHGWSSVSPDFQTEHGYPVDEPSKANLAIGSKAIAQYFRCLALTIEMPFKDNADLPDPDTGWSPERSERLGRSLVNGLLLVINDLKRIL